MKKSEITVGGLYVAKVNNQLTTVRVDSIEEVEGYTSGESYWRKTSPAKTRYNVTNIKGLVERCPDGWAMKTFTALTAAI